MVLCLALSGTTAHSQSWAPGAPAFIVDFQLTGFEIEQGEGITAELTDCPVAIELIDTSDPAQARVLVGIMTMGEAEPLVTVMSMSADVEVDWTSRSCRVSVQAPTGRYRIVLLPSPSFWIPVDAPQERFVTDNDMRFRLTGVLGVADAVGTMVFPPVDSDSPALEFSKVKAPGLDVAIGFSAYLDLETRDGRVVTRELHLTVDRDADGREDYVLPAGEYPPPKHD